MKNNLILKVNGFYLSHLYLSIHSVNTKFIQDVEFTTDKNHALNLNFDEAYEIILVLSKHFKDIEIEEVENAI